MQFHNEILCVSGAQLIKREDNPEGLITPSLWKKWIREGAKLVQRGGNGRVSLIAFDTIPTKYQELIKKKFPDPRAEASSKPFRDKVQPDPKAIEFYSHYTLADGRILPEKHQRIYSINASVLNAIHQIYRDANNARKKAGSTRLKNFWERALTAINNIREDVGHKLPTSKAKLRTVYNKYVEKGYEGLVSEKFCNDNSRKVSQQLENLILSLYVMKNKPFAADVHQMLTMFLAGKLEVADRKTGEILKPEDFWKDGKPMEVSESTVKNYLNQPDNRSIVDSKRSGQFEYNNQHRPHHHRKSPQYSFSKVSMDDRDLPRRLINGGRVKAYYAYDVASGCVIGKAYSRSKNEELFLDCMRDMFRMIEREGLKMPLQVEVENHLVSRFFDDLSLMFQWVRICNPGNSQEKRAEHFNRAKKYGVEKKMQTGIGRWWAKGEAYRVDAPKVNDEFVEKPFSYEELVADDIAAIMAYNNQMHPRQKRYPGKTRWQVLIDSVNPNAADVSKPVVYKAIGERTDTSIRRNQYAVVKGAEYRIPGPEIMDRLAVNNYDVQAYYLPDNDGLISEVYLYQGATYLCKCSKIERYNEAAAEMTEQDDKAYLDQAKYVAQFDKRKKEQKNNLMSPEIMVPLDDIIEPEIIDQPTGMTEEEEVEQLANSFDPEEYAKRAIDNL